MLEVGMTTLVFAAVLFLLGLKAEDKKAAANEPAAEPAAQPEGALAKILVMPKRC